MTDAPTSAGKVDPETLALRASPRPVVRFKRRLMIGIAAFGIAGIFGLTWLALQGPVLRLRTETQELYRGGHKQTPEGLDALPKDYSEIEPETPLLGPPLPGDLGAPILKRQRELGLPPGTAISDIDREAEAERQRLAQQARAAKEAEVFFEIANQPETTKMLAGDSAASPAPSMAAGAMSGEGNPLPLDPTSDPNAQARKLAFLNARGDGEVYNAHAIETPVSAYQVMAGSIIAAALVTGLNSDLPGDVIAQVTENVYDSPSGRHLLIPQGSRLIGAYDSVIAFGQSRALVVWRRIIMPDGSSIEIDNLPATDAAGYAGLEDAVDLHAWRLLKGVALATLLGIGKELDFGAGESDLLRVMREMVQQGADTVGQRLIEKTLDVQPTITVRPGWPVRVIVAKDLVLRPYHG